MGLKTITACLGYQQFTAAQTTTVQRLTIPAGNGLVRPNFVRILGEAAGIRYRDDGVDPTPAVGMFLSGTQYFDYDGDLNKIRFINSSAGTIINVLYYAGQKNITSCLGFQQVTATSASFGLTVPQGATMARINTTSQIFRYRDDGVDPTTGVGMVFPVNTTIDYTGDLNKIRLITITPGGILNVSYYA